MRSFIARWQLLLIVLTGVSCSKINATDTVAQDFCGLVSQKSTIALTEEKIIKTYHPSFPTSPYPDGVNKGCVGVSFSISPEGVAFNVEISKSSHARVFDKAAIKAIQNYRFQKGSKIIKEAYLVIDFDIGDSDEQ